MLVYEILLYACAPPSRLSSFSPCFKIWSYHLLSSPFLARSATLGAFMCTYAVIDSSGASTNSVPSALLDASIAIAVILLLSLGTVVDHLLVFERSRSVLLLVSSNTRPFTVL